MARYPLARNVVSDLTRTPTNSSARTQPLWNVVRRLALRSWIFYSSAMWLVSIIGRSNASIKEVSTFDAWRSHENWN
jgi:hypothetical protein